MRKDQRESRMREIEAEAYALFAQAGFENTSMLAVAKRAKASNETMYRWYGYKNGLFASMVAANARVVRDRLQEAANAEVPPLEILSRVAPVLLEMLLSERAILLNRAAASDSTGALGQLLALRGREDVLPLIDAVLQDAVREGQLHPPDDGPLPALFMHLLLGDQQIRRVIGTMPAPTKAEIAAQATLAISRLRALCV
ncbi:Transcriptional regulator, TetR family protein [Sulfitobacter noctilucae]|uniref:TetR/AcrR family transcriptional regulator n=1 Tax=Sulfitobacter noctilucae TaxID=1342302 RepID=UPI0004694594|nr:TetR/AcrR family transcriptional regulator [Sulfitobacter noctilucae]KIN75185.1 Transcriptional regulator, TetR family protein [Sulfitobacter noctilucae]